MKNLIGLSKSLNSFLKPAVGYIDMDLGVPTSLSEALNNSTMKDIAAINLISPAIVEHFGKKKLLYAPAWEVRELDDGGVFMALTPNPFDDNEVNKKKKEVRNYLGLK